MSAPSATLLSILMQQLPDGKFTLDGQIFTLTKLDGTVLHYDIEAAKRVSASNPVMVMSLSQAGLSLEMHRRTCECDEDYAMAHTSVTPSNPVILVPLDNGTETCIDGNHRIRAALLNGEDDIYCVALSEEQANSCVICREVTP